MAKNLYSKDFFSYHKQLSLDSAKIIVKIFLNNININSVVDIGCGNGAWLRVFLDSGIKNILGYDLSDHDQNTYLINKSFIKTSTNILDKDFKISNEFDLALCLEVAEHIPKRYSKKLVECLTSHSSIIMFSAAIPGQKGVGHINEQPPSFWRNLFIEKNFMEIDFIRPQIWKNYYIAWWYRQNVTVFVSNNLIQSSKDLRDLSKEYPKAKENENLVLISERILNSYYQSLPKRVIKFLKRKLND